MGGVIYERFGHTYPMELTGDVSVHSDVPRVNNIARSGPESKGEVDVGEVLGGEDEGDRGDGDNVENLDDIDIAHLEGIKEGEELDYSPEGD